MGGDAFALVDVDVGHLSSPGFTVSTRSPDTLPNKGSNLPCLPIRVIGLSDGLTVPFALTAGLSSLGESKLVVLGGIAELIAGAISMGIGGFLASQAERDHHRYLRRATKARVQRSCDGEMEREVHAVLGPVGVDQNVSRQVALNLLEVESAAADRSEGSSDVERSLKWSHSVGVTEFLLKFGEGMGAFFTACLFCCVDLGLRHVPQRRSQHAACTSPPLQSGWATSLVA